MSSEESARNTPLFIITDALGGGRGVSKLVQLGLRNDELSKAADNTDYGLGEYQHQRTSIVLTIPQAAGYSKPLIAQMSPPCGRKRSNITHLPSGDQTG
jgi:hypothetical protein